MEGKLLKKQPQGKEIISSEDEEIQCVVQWRTYNKSIGVVLRGGLSREIINVNETPSGVFTLQASLYDVSGKRSKFIGEEVLTVAIDVTKYRADCFTVSQQLHDSIVTALQDKVTDIAKAIPSDHIRALLGLLLQYLNWHWSIEDDIVYFHYDNDKYALSEYAGE